jgi:hypothetical protein
LLRSRRRTKYSACVTRFVGKEDLAARGKEIIFLLNYLFVFGIVSPVNRGQEVVHDKVSYLAAHAIAAGQISAEMDAGKNSA